MISEQIERVKIWLEELKKDFYTPVGEVSLHRMTTFENLGFDRVHSLVAAQMRSKEWDIRELTGEPVSNLFYAKYPAEWGRKWEYGWFVGAIDSDRICNVPEGSRLELVPDVGGEMLIEINGQLAGSRDLKHTGVTLSRSYKSGESFDILIESYSGHGPRLENGGPLFYGEVAVPEPPMYQVKTGHCTYGIWNEDAFQLYMDANTLWQLYQCIDSKTLRAEKIIAALFEFTRIADFECEPELRNISYRAAREALADVLSAENGDTAPVFSIFGQSHLDLAWKWTREETRRKCARTYSTQLALLDEYPDYIFFGCSPYILESIRQDYPELFERIVQKIKEGRIVVDGGMFVESDTNIPAGEALIRQIAFAKEWCDTFLGSDVRMVWLPDCFGFSGQLPQIMKKSGIDYFSTQKLFRALEGCEQFPYNDFYWEGIDGTRIPTHFYKKNNARFEVKQVYERWDKDRVQHEDFDEMMFPFGFGDGGGGATRDMLETAERVRDLEGLPRCRWEDPVSFMDRLNDRLKAKKTPNVYRGELYLPWHRGTYTSQAAIKFANRKTESALREADLWCSVAVGMGLIDVSEVSERLKEMWLALMFLQFHDILPGTSIERVNREALTEFGKIDVQAVALAERMKGLIRTENGLIWNPISTDRRVNAEGMTVPSCGYIRLANKAHEEELRNDPLNIKAREDGSVTITNGRLTAAVDRRGRVTSLKLNGREYLSAPANVFRLYKDINIAYDAWELASFYREEEIEDAFIDASITDFGINKTGPSREIYIDVEKTFGESRLIERITLSENGQQLEFSAVVDWHETHKMLRVDFPTVINSDHIIAETQYGYVTRPNHASKRSDADRFEGAMHRFCALAGDNCGVLVLNDGKYGCSAQGGNISVALLRAAKFPDMNADMGENFFSYALRPYEGSFAMSKAALVGMEFNSPLELPSFDGEVTQEVSFFNCEADSTVLDWVKLAGDESGDIILRLYESTNSFENAVISSAFEFEQVVLCDMLENSLDKTVEFKKNSEGRTEFTLDFAPFEVKTVRLVLKK